MTLFEFVIYLIVLPYDRTVAPTASDEPHYLLITQSLLYDHDLDLRNDYDGDRYSAFYPAKSGLRAPSPETPTNWR